jgi:hypothetical protein
MIHIVVEHGIVMQVVVLGNTPDDRPDVLELETDYKVEYYPCDDEAEQPPF